MRFRKLPVSLPAYLLLHMPQEPQQAYLLLRKLQELQMLHRLPVCQMLRMHSLPCSRSILQCSLMP
jgi:hypothetical protein